jgi:hypothetical protein
VDRDEQVTDSPSSAPRPGLHVSGDLPAHCVKYQERFLKAQREAREANRGLWGLSAGELCQQTDRDNGIGGGCSASEPESPAASQSASPGSGGDSNLECASFDTHEQAQRLFE